VILFCEFSSSDHYVSIIITNWQFKPLLNITSITDESIATDKKTTNHLTVNVNNQMIHICGKAM